METETMEISFTNDFIATERFENEYEEELQEDPEVREAIIRHGLVVYMWLDDVLVGECFGISPYECNQLIKEEQIYEGEEDVIADIDMSDRESVYVWSTTLVPQMRGLGYGKVLREEFANYASRKGYAKLVGHATSESMVHIVKEMGGIFHWAARHELWFGTSRTVHFYTQFLPQTKEWNCGPFALAYLLEMKEHTYNIHDLEISLHTGPERGTDPQYIEKFLAYKQIPFKVLGNKLEPNSIIDITVDTPDGKEGHWITVIGEAPGFHLWKVYDPAIGVITYSEEFLLNRWYSVRYGKFLGFALL
jgi:GNAT superfamily N-acetyltransferase